MEYGESENNKHQSKAEPPDLLTQSLTSVFGKSAAVVSPVTPQEEVYAVPIQRYPDFNVPAAQNTPVQGPVTEVSPGDKSKNVPSQGSSIGDLISEAWSLSCDMTRAWQKADDHKVTSTPSNQPTNQPPVSVDKKQNSANLSASDTEVQPKNPEIIPVQKVEIPVKDCVIVDIGEENITSVPKVQEKPSCGKESEPQKESQSMQLNTSESKPKDCTDELLHDSEDIDVSGQQDAVSVRSAPDIEVDKDNVMQVTSTTIKTKDSGDGVTLQQQLKPAQSTSPEKVNQGDEKKLEPGSKFDLPKSPEIKTPESKRQRVKSGNDSSNSTTPARLSDSAERPQRKRKLPIKLTDDAIIKDSPETNFILKQHSKSLTAPTPSSAGQKSAEDAEAERLKQQKLKQFQRLYVMSQRGLVPDKPTDKVEEIPSGSPPPPLSTETSPPNRTFSLMDIGISLNAKGEVTLSMPDKIKKLAKSGGSININFDVDCLDKDNCLKFKVTEDKEAITTALGTSESPDIPHIESEASSEPDRSDSPKIKTETMEMCDPTVVTNRIINNKPSRDSSVQVDLTVTNSEEDYLNEKLLRASTATGFVSYPRFTNVSGSSLATVHKVLKNVKKGLSIDKLTKKPTWFCSLCYLTGDYGDMGPLFGPFDIYVPPKSSYRNKNMSDGAKNLFEKLSSTFNTDLAFSDENEITVEREEVWLHEDCICWSPGVYMIGFDIYGLEEIFKVARFTVCSECGEIGASLGCFKEGCSNRYHYRCAIKAKCKLIKTTFTVLCPTHSHGIVDNCLAVKPLMKVRNYLSQEEINESEELLSRRPGDDAREFAVKITKTRIIRSRKNKKTKEKRKSAPGPAAVRKIFKESRRSAPIPTRRVFDADGQVLSRKRGRPRKHPKVVSDNDEEEEAVENVPDQGDGEANETGRKTYECFGCGYLFIRNTSIRKHFKSRPGCRQPHIQRCIDNENILPPETLICFSCGHFVEEGKMMGHLSNVPQQCCKDEHIRVVRDVKGLDVKEYFKEDKRKLRPRQREEKAPISGYKCFGCFHPFNTRRTLRDHLKSRPECHRTNLEHLIANDNDIPSEFKLCYGCGSLIVKSTVMELHYRKQEFYGDCRRRHEAVMREKRDKIPDNDEGEPKNEVMAEEWVDDRKHEKQTKYKNIPAENDNEEEIVGWFNHEVSNNELKLYCPHKDHKFASPQNMNRHIMNTNSEACLSLHIEGFLESGDRVPAPWMVCLNCGCFVKKIHDHVEKSDRGCTAEHLTVGGGDQDEDVEMNGEGQESDAAEEGEREENTAVWKLYCSHNDKDYRLKSSLHRHLRQNIDCVETHINGFFTSGDRAPEGCVFCLNCGYYVLEDNREMHFKRLDNTCKFQDFVVRGSITSSKRDRGGSDNANGESASDQEDVEMDDVEVETPSQARDDAEEDKTKNKDEAEEVTEVIVKNKGKKVKPVKVKVEMIASAEVMTENPFSSPSTSAPLGPTVTTPSKPQGEGYFKCSQCETKTKDRAYLKKHYRVHHCPVGCGDYDLICTTCVKALKLIVTFPRGLEGYDYSAKANNSKLGLKCPECPTISQKHNAHYIRSHYREQHCKIGCAQYDQLCLGCVAVLEKLTEWPKPLIGHDYSTGPPPVGFQCPKCRKGIDRQYFKRHYRHLHCKVHCIEKDVVCKKCFAVFKRMNMLTKADGRGG